MDLNKIKHVHFSGIKGVAMTALALCLQDLGKVVTGNDTSEYFVTDELLKKRNIKWKVGFGEKYLKPKPDLLVATAAHGGLLNPEVQSALKNKIPVLTYAEMLAELANSKETICVSGVGGKTTTSSMITVMLDSAKLNPSFAVGVGNIYPLGVSGRYSLNGKHFICEADEYAVSPGVNNSPKFSLLNPKVVVVTNIEHDHPDIYPDFESMKIVFKEFFTKIHKYGLLIAGVDNLNVKEIIKGLNIPIITYGFSKDAGYQIRKVRFTNEKTIFDIYIKKSRKLIENIEINLPGKFNIQNATAAYIVGVFYQLDSDLIKMGLQRYLGCRRRFEPMPQFMGARFFDDYAHHPTEISSTLKAAREWFPKSRIIAIFQPHTYSRTKVLFKEFSKAFSGANVIGIMDIYASARETKDDSITSAMLAKEIKKQNKATFYLQDHKKTINWLKGNIKLGDIVITMGAGDIFHIYNNLYEKR